MHIGVTSMLRESPPSHQPISFFDRVTSARLFDYPRSRVHNTCADLLR